MNWESAWAATCRAKSTWWWQAHNIQALNARLLHRAELSEADLIKLPCEAYNVMYICNQSDGISRPRSISYPVKVASG